MTRERPDDQWLLGLVTAIADGHSIDWRSIESSLNDTQQSFIPSLRAVAALTAAHASGAVTGDDLGAVVSANESAIAPGTRWGGLEIRERVGRGRYGVVFRAWDPALEREVALKLLEPLSASDAGETSAVVAEGRLMARVRHPNVVAIHGAQRIGGQTGLWMEFVHGRTLADDIREQGPFDAASLTKIGIDLARAVGAVHAAKLIHRDIKPQNVMRDKTGRIVLGDFGIGLDLGEAAEAGRAGTPLYLAPEVYAGGPATVQSDIYALGVLLFHLATGTYPVAGRSGTAIRDEHARGRRVRLADARPDLPTSLTEAIDKALDPEPHRRFAQVVDLEAALAGASAGAGIEPAPPSSLPIVLVLFGLLAVAIALSATGILFERGQSSITLPGALPGPEPGPAGDVPAAPPVDALGPPMLPPAPAVPDSQLVVPAEPPSPETLIPRGAMLLTQLDPSLRRRIRIGAGTADPAVVTCFDLTDQALALCNLVDSTIRRVRPPRPGERLSSPTLSTEGDRMVYVSEHNAAGTVRIVDVAGGQEREIIRATAGQVLLGVRWLSGQRALLVQRRDGPLADVKLQYLVQAEDSPETRLLWSFDNPDAQGIDVSPDGRFIVFDRRGSDGNRELAIVDTASRSVSGLAADGNNHVRPRWTPDGAAVIFQSDRRGRRGLYMMRVVNGVAASEPTLVLDVTRGQATQVAFAGTDGLIVQRQVHWYNAFRARVDLNHGDSTNLRPLDPRTATEEIPSVSTSGDGKLLAYLAGALGDVTRAPPRVVLLDRNGRLVREMLLRGRLSRRSRVRWSPDNERLAVLSEHNRQAVVELFDVPSGTSLRMIEVAGAFDIRFDPSGDGILYAVDRDIRRYDLATDMTGVHYRSASPLRNTSTFDVARDGSLLLPLLNGVHIVRPDGRVTNRYQFSNGETTALAWTSDGRRIIVSGIAGDAGRAAIMVMDAEGGEPTPLPMDVEPIFDLAMSAEDDEIFVSAGNQAPQYWLIRPLPP